MKYIVLVFVLCFQQATAATYYVKASGGTGSGLDDANAWSYSKLNATALAAGDLVLFKRGDSFYGQLTPKSAGRPGSPIVYGPYGTGANPVISGFTQLGSWTLSSGHIYYAPLDVPTLNMVTLDGLVKGMGRYPNSGYLAYTSHSGNSSITGSSVATLPFDPATGEVVMRKNRWILDRHPVTSRSGSTLNYSTNTTYGNNAAYSPVDGNGYFVQNHLGSLDQEGEWFYDKLAKRLYMHFGAGTPTGKVVKASTLVQNLYINYWTNLTFNNIDLEGGNVNGAYVIGTSNITFNQCTFRQQGGNGIWASFTSSVKINGGRISDALNSSIWFEQEATTTTIDGVTVTNSGLIAGAGRSGDHAQEGISIFGTATVIQNCSVINTGYNGINFSGGDNVLVEHNFVDTFCTIKDDGGGIYTYNSTGTNRKISNNIILNAIGTFAGVESNYWEAYGKAAGIYLDGGVSNTEVDHNVVAHGNWGGLFINGVKNHRLTNNLVYNFSQALLIHSYSGLLVRDLSVTGNSFIAKTASQSTLYLHLFTNDDPSLYGTFKNNIYARPIDDTNTIGIYREYAGGSGQTNISLATWKSTYSQDENSAKSLVTTDQLSNLRFDYNYTNKELIVSLDNNYSDVSNIKYTSSIKLPAYGGSVLVMQPPEVVTTYKPVPGRIEAENFDTKQGTCSEPTTDTGGGLNIGCVSNANWLDYNVDVAIAGTYTFSVRVAGGSGQIQLKDSQGTILSTIADMNTGGFQIWKTISKTVILSAGKQTIRIYAQSSGWNLNWFEIASTLDVQPSIVVTNYKPLPGRIEAESSDNKQGTTCSEPTTDIGGGLNIGCVAATNWLDYNVDVAAAGIYMFNVREAGGDGQIQLLTAQGTVLTTINITSTGGFQNWKTVGKAVTLSAGKQTLRIFALRSGWNLNWFEIVSASGGRVSAELTQKINEEAFKLTVYPNPARNTIQVQHPTVFDSGVIQIISIGGQEVKRQVLISGSADTSIDVHLLNPGFYLLHYQNGSLHNTARILKQ